MKDHWWEVSGNRYPHQQGAGKSHLQRVHISSSIKSWRQTLPVWREEDWLTMATIVCDFSQGCEYLRRQWQESLEMQEESWCEGWWPVCSFWEVLQVFLTTVLQCMLIVICIWQRRKQVIFDGKLCRLAMSSCDSPAPPGRVTAGEGKGIIQNDVPLTCSWKCQVRRKPHRTLQ